MSEENSLKVEERLKLSRELRTAWPAMLIIAFGVAMLISNIFHFHLISLLWPGFIIVPGLMLIWPAYNSTPERENVLSFLAVPGFIVSAVGLMLFAMNITNHYEAWAYAWTLLPAAAMAGLMYAQRHNPQSSIHQAGRRVIRMMVTIFVWLAVLFEVVIFQSLGPWLPVALIAFGIYLLVKETRRAR